MRRLVLLACGLFLLMGRAVAQSPPTSGVPLSEYQSLLRELNTATKQRLSPARAGVLEQRVSGIKSVSLPDGTILTPNNAALVKALARIRNSSAPAKLSTGAVDQINVLQSLVAPTDRATTRTQDVRHQLDAILDAKEFREATGGSLKKSWWEELLENIWKSIGDFFRFLFKNLFGNGGGKPTGGQWLVTLVQWILIVFAFVVLAVALFYLLRWATTLMPSARKRTGVLSEPDLLEVGLADPLGASQDLAAKGDYRGALRLAYIATLRRLAGSGMLILQENKTNWEYQRDLHGRVPAAYTALLPATRLFDVIWYGQRAATQDEYAAVVAAHDAVRSLTTGATTGSAPPESQNRPRGTA